MVDRTSRTSTSDLVRDLIKPLLFRQDDERTQIFSANHEMQKRVCTYQEVTAGLCVDQAAIKRTILVSDLLLVLSRII